MAPLFGSNKYLERYVEQLERFSSRRTKPNKNTNGS